MSEYLQRFDVVVQSLEHVVWRFGPSEVNLAQFEVGVGYAELVAILLLDGEREEINLLLDIQLLAFIA